MWSASSNLQDNSPIPSVAYRVRAVLRIGWILAAVVLVAGWIILAVTGNFSAWWVVPAIVAVAIALGTVLFLQRPIWGVDLPDDQIWALLDARGQISQFISGGVHWLSPVQAAMPFTEAGPVQIVIALNPVLTADHYPYRVTVAISLILNPMTAAPSEYGKLRQVTRQGLIDSLGSEVSGQIRAAFLQNAREDNAPSVLIESVKTSVAQIVADYGAIGLALNARNAIQIDLAPPDEVINARTAQWVRETQTEAGVKHLASMLEVAGGYDVSASQLGQLHFSLNMQPNTPITFRGTPGALIEADSSPRSQPRLPAAAELPPTQLPAPTVIETHQDDQGNYVPSDPILSRRPRK